MAALALILSCFNTQPPEGGWWADAAGRRGYYGFNTQPPEGGWDTLHSITSALVPFQHTAA